MQLPHGLWAGEDATKSPSISICLIIFLVQESTGGNKTQETEQKTSRHELAKLCDIDARRPIGPSQGEPGRAAVLEVVSHLYRTFHRPIYQGS